MGDRRDPFDDDYPTKKHSGSLQRGPIWTGLAQALATRMREIQGRFEREVEGVPSSHSDFSDATRTLVELRLRGQIDEARRFAEEATELSAAFAGWERCDPGSAARNEALSRWHDLEKRAHEFEQRHSPSTDVPAP